MPPPWCHGRVAGDCASETVSVPIDAHGAADARGVTGEIPAGDRQGSAAVDCAADASDGLVVRERAVRDVNGPLTLSIAPPLPAVLSVKVLPLMVPLPWLL